MCMFCAAIPAAAAVGANLNAKQRAEIRQAEESGGDVRQKPVKAITAGVIVLLVIGSAVYHTRFNTFI
jgi:hypothetical protein